MKLQGIALIVIIAGLGICAAGLWQSHSRKQDAVLHELKEINRAREWQEAQAERQRIAQAETDRANLIRKLESDRLKAKLDAERREDELRQKLAENWKSMNVPAMRAKAEADLEAARARSEAALGFTEDESKGN
jgi:hypothetical protein